MLRPALEVADIVRQHGAAYRKAHPLSYEQLRVMRAIEVCRTAALGGHVEQCGELNRLAVFGCDSGTMGAVGAGLWRVGARFPSDWITVIPSNRIPIQRTRYD